MQGLVKTQARIKKFVPHSGVTSADQDHVDQNRADQNRSRTGHTMSVLKPEGFDQLAHDVRNILSALRLYCELFAEPPVFLDEIGELPLDLQAKLLRALQEKEIRPVGATHRVSINVRILAASNRISHDGRAGPLSQGPL